MASTFELVKRELQAQNQLQKWLSAHRANSGIYASIYNSENESHSFPTYSFNQGYDITKNPTTAGTDEHFYDIPQTHLIGSVFCTYRLPDLKVKDEYLTTAGEAETPRDRISVSWKPKTGLLAIKSASFVRNSENNEQTLRPHEVNVWIEWFAEKILCDRYESIIEDLEGNTDYDTNHDGKLLLIPQPFFFTPHIWIGFKHVFTPGNKYSLKYKFENDFYKMIRGIRGDGTWLTEEELKEMCTFSFNTMEPPKLHIRLHAFNENEIKDLWNFNDPPPSAPGEPPVEQKKAYVEPIQQLIYRDPEEGILASEGSISISLLIKECVRGIFFYIENVQEAMNQPFLGGFLVGNKYVNPVKKVTLKLFDKDNVYEEEQPIHFTKRLPKQMQLRTPQVVGYHYIPFSNFGILSRMGTDGSLDPSIVGAKLILHYNIPRDRVGKLHIIYDVFRLISYHPNGKYEIHQNTMPPA